MSFIRAEGVIDGVSNIALPQAVIDRDPGLLGPRGLALRTLLYLFERDTAIKYLRTG